MTLLTPAEVVSLAFKEGEYLPAEAIAEADIAAATDRYIVPVVGREIVDALYDHRFPTLMAEYVAPALAMAVRVAIQRSINVRSGSCGLALPYTNGSAVALHAAADALQRSLCERLRSLLRRLSSYLREGGEGAECYDERNDITLHCSTYGGIVQIY